MALRAVALAMTSLVLSLSMAQGAPLRMAVEGDGAYAPFSFFDKAGHLTGFDIDVAKALCAQVKDGCEIIPVNWEVIVDGLASGKFDAAVASIAFSKERADKIAYGASYYRSHSVFVGRPDSFADVTPAGLKGARVASSQGTIQQLYLSNHYKQSTVVEPKDFDDAFAKLKDGSVDLVLADAIACMEFLQSKDGEAFAFVGDPLTGEELQSASYITLRKGIDGRAAELNAALDHIRLDGSYDKINRTYVPFSIF